MKKQKKNYHSALTQPLKIEKELSYYGNNGNFVIKRDICKGLPEEFRLCDVIYSEPSWLMGYEKFLSRASTEGSDYKKYIESISGIIKKTNKPIWIVTGRHALKHFPIPHHSQEIKLFHHDAFLLGWNDRSLDWTDFGSIKTTDNLLEILSDTYDRVGDFCCGYGNTARAFLNKGKEFVMSDINGKCVYYIAKELMGYA